MSSAKLQFGPYKAERVIGRGGMGVVYAAVNGDTGQRVAVKVLTHSLAHDMRLRDRFASEIEALKLLKHPRIVELFGFGEQEGQLFYAMELVAGRSLQDEMAAGRQFTWREVAQIGVEMCDALKHAHDHGVVHRDLKPANLLLDDQGRSKLSDFGIAKMFGGSQLTADGGVLGTADYMSPEQAEGRPATVRSDLYSLGSVLYALLARRAPFESKTLHEVIHRLIHEEPQPLSRWTKDVPAELEALIHQLLKKDPQERIGTALAVGKRLQAIAQEQQEAPLELPLETPPGDDEYRLADDPGDRGQATQRDVLRGTRPTLAMSPGAPPEREVPADSELSVAPGVEVHLKPTVVRAELADSRHGQGSAAAVAPTTRFTTVDKHAPRDDSETDRFLWLKLAALGLVVALLLSGAGYALWPPSAETLYRHISQTAAAGEAAKLLEVESEIDRFLARFPADDRAEQVAAWKEEIERNRLRKRFERQTRRPGAGSHETPVERLYLEALQDVQFAPERAAGKLQALIDVFGEDPAAPDTTKRCVELAKKELASLQSAIETAHQEQLTLFQERLERADALSQTDPAAAQTIWRGIVKLYADKPWAADLVSRAQEKLVRAK